MHTRPPPTHTHALPLLHLHYETMRTHTERRHTELLQVFEERFGREVCALHRAEEEHPRPEDGLGRLGLDVVGRGKGLYPREHLRRLRHRKGRAG